MAKAKNTDAQETETVSDKGAFRITYMQGEEPIELTFFDAERRDYEFNRLASSGVIGMTKVDV